MVLLFLRETFFSVAGNTLLDILTAGEAFCCQK